MIQPLDVAMAVSAMSIVSFTLIRLVQIVVGRNKGPSSAPQLQGIDDRLTRIEVAIESMAIEVERISEGQRFTTKLLSARATKPDGQPV
jgi:hypothetical protein